MPDRSAEKPVRVVIVGGGCAGMAAAWELAKQPGYEIHVYEKTPRLGGKGSSTRDEHGRILEHGLHVWMGWYENAFRMMRQCYSHVEDKLAEEEKLKLQEKDRDPKWRELAHGRFDDAFMPEPNVGLIDPKFHGEPVMWSVLFPPNEGQPGTPMMPEDNPFTMAAYMTRSMEMVRSLILSMVEDIPGQTPGPPRPDRRSRSDEILSLDIQTPAADSTAALLNRMAAVSRAGALTGAAALLQLVTMLEAWLRRQNIGPKAPESTLAIAEAAVSQARKLLRDLVGVDKRLRMKTEVIDIVLTIMIGLFNDRVMFRKDGLDSLNDYDYREWLNLHGATKTSLESRFIRAAYDFAFAYVDGNLGKPRLAAGVAIRGGFRMFFTYRGAAFWRMCSGMGDAVFAPLYAVLEDWQANHDPVKEEQERKRKAEEAKAQDKDVEPEPWHTLRSPVHFHFGHELKKAHFAAGGLSLTQLDFHRGAIHDPPLTAGAWPDHAPMIGPPTVEGPTLTRRDNPSEDLGEHQFDFAIIATGLPEFSEVFVKNFKDGQPDKPSTPALNAWAATSGLTKTVATKSAQVWLQKDLYDLGWRRGSGLFTCMQGETFDTYADMTHILAAEQRGVPEERRRTKWRSLAYFCNPLQDDPVPKPIEERERAFRKDGVKPEVLEAIVEKALHEELGKVVKADLERLITDQMDAFWPHLFEAEEKMPRDKRVEEWRRRLHLGEADAYTRANTKGSERYTLSVPGSIASRVSPLDEWVDNMTVAGDWTACGLDCGCVEAAVVSGMLAAAAISGKPEISDIVGYDQP